MKRVALVLSMLIFAASAVTLLFLYGGRNVHIVSPTGTKEAAAVSLEPASSQRLELPLNKPQRVDFSIDETSFADLSVREREDQYRDWLLFAAVAALQSSAEDYSNVLYDLPASRQGYMRPVGNFEFGETRSRFVGGGRVLALVPAGRPPAERKDLLAQIADEQRKNLGTSFDRLTVVEYELDAAHASGALTKREDIDYATLFSAEYGYSEKAVTKLSDLDEFMMNAADLTLVRKTANGLLLGGRRLLSRKYRSIGAEEIATVWQAEQKIQVMLARKSAITEAFDARWSYRTYKTAYEKDELDREYQDDLRKTKEQLDREFKNVKLVNGSGFSLDPGIDYPGLKQAFDRFAPSLEKIAPDLVSREDASAVSLSLSDRDVLPLRRLQVKVSETTPILGELIHAVERENSYQAARYDGALQGTEVGMVLFYTDLLAKLWTIDFVKTSPRHGIISEFLDDPSVPTSAIYEAEKRALPYARLWFGHSNLGFQVAEQKSAVFLARGVTRIYSAGSDPLKPGEEVETSAFLAASTDWWNDHYEEVARYEQEYERLNEIMKWSIVIGWLNESNEGARLGFLANVQVDHSKVFPDWVLHHPELKFNRWSDIHFFPAGYKGTTTEALPLLNGPVTEGGVSLASKGALRRAPIASDLEKTILRSNLDYAATGAKDSLTTLEGVGFKFSKTDVNRVSVLAQAKPAAKFRGATVQFARSEVERTVVTQSNAVRVETRLAERPIGDLEIGRSSNGFRVGWRAREIDRAHGLARALSASRQPDALLLQDPAVETVVKLPGDASYAVKLSDSQQWVRFAPEQRPSVDIAGGWQLRAAVDENQAVRTMQASLINDSDLSTLIGRHVVIETSDGGKPLLRAGGDAATGPARTIEVDFGGGTRLSAWTEPPSEAVHLGAKGGSSVDPALFARRLSPDDIKAIRAAASNDNTPVLRLADKSRLSSDFAAAFQDRDFEKIAGAIATDPKTSRVALDVQMQNDLRHDFELLRNKGANEALRDLDRLIEIYGHQPELTLRRGLVEIERGNVKAAVESVQLRAPRPLNNRQAFFDEVNARYVKGSTQAKADIYRYAEFADWQDRIARTRAGGLIEPTIAADGRFDFQYRLNDLSAVKQVSAAEGAGLRGKDFIVYSQDGASLNKLDWTTSVDESLRTIVSGKLGTVSRLEQQDIAHFRPSVVWSPDHAVAFKATQTHSFDFSVNGYQACNSLVGTCANDNDSNKRKDNVYLVAAK
ncbi:hypothetical protein [Bradyrhizobium ganzhouense]|uniref:hypothetical protein n=1 Tax=Bradyrhizobium ganzhouense TaxID=1179767 RepID=UPI003CF357E1